MRHLRTVVIAAAAVCALPAAANASVIVYRCGNPANLCRVNPDGSGQQQLTTDGAANPYQGASLDLAGDRMVLTRNPESAYAADGGAQNAVGPIDTYALMPKISFDGSRMVDFEYFPSLSATFICTFQTAPSSDSTWGRHCGAAGRYPAFTPAGQIVASQLRNGHDAVCLMDSQASGCTRDIAADSNADLDEAAVSPDGQTLAVVAMSSGTTGPIELFSTSSGQLQKVLTNGADETPAFSPDGTQIVFARGGSLYTVPVSGGPGSEHLLVAGGDTPTWGGPVSSGGSGGSGGGTGGSGGSGGSGGTGGSGGNGGSGGTVTVPNTKLARPKLDRRHHRVTLTFKALGTATGFQCALVKQVRHRKAKPRFSACRSPKTYAHLRAGTYLFYVRAGNRAGRDRTPASTKIRL